ncbi:DnaD domain protein [Bacillus thuringiensis]|uniref:DnaD domain protein n=1 Tax=Bacillus thuringiensis serovar andalousiensis TaxID=257985 RepID=A0A6H0TNZ7_BACTU|nr:DnaD domain protein [Bacillus thuringiensis]QIW22159.1 DnaD domain protein [Bacillus thuringiensis serovar andalousiensis]
MDKQQEEWLRKLNTCTPEQLLSDMPGDANIPKDDLRFFPEKDLHIIDTVRDTFRLPDPVINVLIYYVMLKMDMRFPKAYVEKIAGHWARKKITTVDDALALVKKEHRQYQKWMKGQKQEKKDPHEITVIDSITGAITAGLTDEQLGRYVRNLLVK